MGLKINFEKQKMLIQSIKLRRINNLIIGDNNIDTVDNFIYIGLC